MASPTVSPSDTLIATCGRTMDPDGLTPGGFGAVLLQGDRKVTFAGKALGTTVLREELSGLLQVLHAVPAGSTVRVTTTEPRISRAFSAGWPALWKRDGWRKWRGRPLQEAALWAEVAAAVDRLAPVLWRCPVAGARLQPEAAAIASAQMRAAVNELGALACGRLAFDRLPRPRIRAAAHA